MLKWQNEGHAVLSVITTVSAKHWKEYVEEEWTELTQGITGEVRLMVLAGVHGDPKGKVGEDAKNVQDCINQAVIILYQFNYFLILSNNCAGEVRIECLRSKSSVFDRERVLRTVLRVCKLLLGILRPLFK